MKVNNQTVTTKSRFTHQDHIVRGKRLNKDQLLADKEKLRDAIFTFGCFSKDMRFTTRSVMDAFGIKKHIAFARIEELISRKRVRRIGRVENGYSVFQIWTVEE